MLSFLAAAALASSSSHILAQGSVDPEVTAAVGRANNNPDIESVSKEANTTGNKFASNQIALNASNVRALVKGLADAIINKPSAPAPATPVDPNRIENKADEIGEVAAFVQGGLMQNLGFKNFKKARALTLAVLQSALATAKMNPALLADKVVQDVAGSVALTIRLSTSVSNKMERRLKNYLILKAKSVAGAARKRQVVAGLKGGFRGDQLRYEDGNKDDLSTVSDPETDFRNI